MDITFYPERYPSFPHGSLPNEIPEETLSISLQELPRWSQDSNDKINNYVEYLISIREKLLDPNSMEILESKDIRSMRKATIANFASYIDAFDALNVQIEDNVLVDGETMLDSSKRTALVESDQAGLISKLTAQKEVKTIPTNPSIATPSLDSVEHGGLIVSPQPGGRPVSKSGDVTN